MVINHIPVPTLHKCRKSIMQKASPNFVFNLPFCYSTGQNLFASHQCLVLRFLASEELAPPVFHSLVDLVTVTQVSRPVCHPVQRPSCTTLPTSREAKHTFPTVPHPRCAGQAGPTSRHTSSFIQQPEISIIVGKNLIDLTSAFCEVRF